MTSRQEMYANAMLLVENGNNEGAISALEKLLESHPDFGQAHYDLGSLYVEVGEKEKALEHYQESIQLEPGNTNFCKGLADFYYVELGDAGQAAKSYHMVLETDPQDCETLMILGNLAVVEGKFEEARDFYQKILDTEPWNEEAAMFVEKLDRKLQHDTGDQTPDGHYQKSQEFFQSGNIEGAIKELETMLSVQPESALAHNDLGVLYFQCDSKDQSLVHYEEAVRLEPDNPVYLKNLADFYFVVLGRIEDALEIYLRLLTEDPTDIETLMATGHICKVIGSPDKAKVFFKRVLDIEPWNLEANENLNQIHMAQQPESNEAIFKNQI